MPDSEPEPEDPFVLARQLAAHQLATLRSIAAAFNHPAHAERARQLPASARLHEDADFDRRLESLIQRMDAVLAAERALARGERPSPPPFPSR